MDFGRWRIPYILPSVASTRCTARSIALDTPFVIYHPSLTEFAEEFDLHQLVVEQDGKEPTPQQIQALIEEARRQGVRVVFIQQEFDSKLIQSIASELGARTVLINPLDGNWEAQLRGIAHALSDTSTPLPTR